MTKQIEFDWVKEIPTKQIPRMGKVYLQLEYMVDLNDEGMVNHARECLYEDIMSLVKCDEVFNAINVDEAPDASYDDIPDFLIESLDDLNQE